MRKQIRQFLWILPEDKITQRPHFTRPPDEIKHFPWFNRKEEIEDTLLETSIHEKKFMDKLEKKKEKRRKVSRLNESIGSFDMLEWYERLKGKKEVRRVYLWMYVKEKVDDPSKHFRWDMSRILAMTEEGKEVLNILKHKERTGWN